MVTSLQLVTKH